MNPRLFEECLVAVWANKGMESIAHWPHVRAHINGALCLCEPEPEQRDTLLFLYEIANHHARNS
jgi:hypothetical protein